MSLEHKFKGTTIKVLKDDLTAMDVEAFVFYARPDLALGSGYGTAIAQRGGPAVTEELKALGEQAVGAAVITGGGELKAKHIIHAVGPAFQEEALEAKLKQTLDNVFKRAAEKGIVQLALPPMGTGFYGVSLDTAAEITVKALREHLQGTSNLKEVILCMRDTKELKPFETRVGALN